MEFNKHVLDIDPAAETDRLVNLLRKTVRQELRRYGAVVGVSGGVDSATVFALCARAFGPKRVVAVMMPEKDSDTESEKLARKLAARFQVETVLLENITPTLEGFGCYPRRDEAIERIFPEYDPDAGYKAKIVLPSNVLEDSTLNVFSVAIVTPDGEEKSKRLPVGEFLQIVAASNLKQRSRMAMLYYHAESRNYAVIGTSNKNEHHQGFLVKYGDSGVDIVNAGRSFTLRPGERKLVPSGIAVEIPEGFEIQIRPRSGLALKSGVTVLNSPGTVDSSYRGELKIILINFGKKAVKIKRFERIAQAVLAKVEKIKWLSADKLGKTARGAGGFGSTKK